MDIGADTSSQEVVDAFTTGAGEVKYFRWCSKEGSDQRLALVEFTDYGAIPAAMRLNNTVLGESTIKVDHQLVTCCEWVSKLVLCLGLLQQPSYYETPGQE